ncbi:MAG: PD-(D/E)XK nuclease family protein, partial [Lachnospiraceae bacterium]|nr:PD-(D/E)XK nuclease family protein [Lachnospiraceae bacterium]
DLLAEEMTAKTDAEARRANLESDEYRNPALEDILLSRFSFVYPHEAYQNLFTKTTVTELKEALLEEAETGEARTALRRTRRLFSYTSDHADTVPSFLREDASEGARPLTGAAYGLLTHKAMELVWRRAVTRGGDTASFADDAERIRAFLEAEDAAGRLDARGADESLFTRIAAFMRTPLAARMRQAAAAGRLFPEKPFMLGVSARELDRALPENEILLIQGIIDCYFEEPDGLTVLDYKTDRVRDEAELVTRYKAQLDYYARALTQITGRNVKERLIYSFALERVIVL